MDRDESYRDQTVAPPSKRKPIRPLFIGGIAGACVLGAGLGLWARPGAAERQNTPPAPAAVQTAEAPVHKLEIVKVDQPLAPPAAPLEVLTVKPAPKPSLFARLLPAMHAQPKSAAQTVQALPKAPPPGLVRVAQTSAPVSAGFAEPDHAAAAAATVAAAAAADAAVAAHHDRQTQLAAAKAARAQKAADKAKADARMAQLAKAKAERRAEMAAAAKAKAEKQAELAQAAQARKEKAHELQLAKLKAAKDAKALKLAKIKAAHEAKAVRLAEAKRQAADKAKADAEAQAQAREEQKKTTRLAALVRSLRAVVHRQQADAAVHAQGHRNETLAAPSHNNGLVKVNATSGRCASSDPGAALVCADPGLGAADRQMSRAYRQAEAAGVPTSELRQQQSRWLAARAAAAREAPWAVRDVYQARIAELNDLTRQAHDPQ